jgi:hypothetical protein
MRFVPAGLVLLASAAALAADAPPARRFGVEADLKSFPQATPQEALASVLKAIDLKRADYLVAHLADPQFVDQRVKETSYDDMLAEVTAKLINDPGAAKQLRNFLKEGSWSVEDATASVSLKEVPDRTVFFRKAGGRWFLAQPYKKPGKKAERQ